MEHKHRLIQTMPTKGKAKASFSPPNFRQLIKANLDHNEKVMVSARGPVRALPLVQSDKMVSVFPERQRTKTT